MLTSWLEACSERNWAERVCVWVEEARRVWSGEGEGGPRAETMPWVELTSAGFSSGSFSEATRASSPDVLATTAAATAAAPGHTVYIQDPLEFTIHDNTFTVAAQL